MSLILSEKKWFRNAIAGMRTNWVQMVKKSATFDSFVQGISALTKIPAAQIAKSLPAQNYREFASNPGHYLNLAVKNLTRAFRARSWSQGYVQAFQGTAGRGPLRKLIGRIRKPKRKRSKRKKQKPEEQEQQKVKRKRSKRTKRKGSKRKRSKRAKKAK